MKGIVNLVYCGAVGFASMFFMALVFFVETFGLGGHYQITYAEPNRLLSGLELAMSLGGSVLIGWNFLKGMRRTLQ